MNSRRSKSKLPQSSLADSALQKIRDKILDLSLAPGMQLDESLITTRLGISRTPAREALNRLVIEGLVENRSSRGFFVKNIDLGDISHLFDAYIAMERVSGYFCRFSDPMLLPDLTEIQTLHEAATRQNDFLAISYENSRFHLRIIATSENPYLIDSSSKLHNLARRLGTFVYKNESTDSKAFEDQQRQIIKEHRLIVDAITKQDRIVLLDILTSHAERFRTRIARFMTSDRGVHFEMPVGFQSTNEKLRKSGLT